MAKTKTQAKSKSRGTKKSTPEKEYIVIDEEAGLIVESESDLFGYFAESIQALEEEYQAVRAADNS